MQPIEVEVKFFLANRIQIRRRILDLGAVARGRHFETNLCFDTPDGTLRRRQSLLRLRQDSRTTLTFKSPAPVADPQYKIRKELEVEVGDFAVMQQIITALGLHPVRRYEKWRETLVLENVVCCLDTMPFGEFLEIEGPRENIRSLAQRLGLPWQRRIVLNYLGLFQRLQQHLGIEIEALTFDAFETTPLDPETCARLFESPDTHGTDLETL